MLPRFVCGSLLLLVFTASPSYGVEDSPSKAGQVFAKMKKLVGDWVELDAQGKPTGKIVTSFRLTAGGSALIETIFPGTDHEMVSVYHLDKDDLVLTHYCVLNNQPRLKADLASPANTIVFNCVSVGNAKDADAQHIHKGTIVFVGEDRLDAKWDMCEKGKCSTVADVKLARKR
jgi:hypothetical protein